MTERRARRSETMTQALSLLLESHRDRLLATGLAVATRDGRVLAGAGPSPEGLVRDAMTGAAPVATWQLRAGGLEVILAARGGRLNHEVGSGVRRILDACARS